MSFFSRVMKDLGWVRVPKCIESDTPIGDALAIEMGLRL
jgi:hypothetical protein